MPDLLGGIRSCAVPPATPIGTRYAGCHFRSRLEARWAVFFDALGVRWEYEREGFEWEAGHHDGPYGGVDLLGGRYLPDFWLPGLDTFYEVKGPQPTSEEERLCREINLTTGLRIILAWGGIPAETDETGLREIDRLAPQGVRDLQLNGSADYDYAWCVCPWCGKPGIEYNGRGARICGWKAHHATEHDAWNDERFDSARHWRVDDKCYTGDAPKILAAFNAARSARFEHGQSGPT